MEELLGFFSLDHQMTLKELTLSKKILKLLQYYESF